MKIFKWAVIFWAALGTGVFAWAGEGSEDEKPIDISADHVVQDNETGMVKAWGNVLVRFEDRTLKADKVKVHRPSGVGEAKGNIEFLTASGTHLKARRARFNIKTKRGKIFHVLGKLEKKYYVRGREVTRLDSGHYLLEDSSLTTCRGKLPAWVIEASHIDVIKDDRAWFTHGVFRVKGVPVFYLPAGYIPINRTRKSGLLLPTLGLSNTDGFTFGEEFYWAINRWSDATLSVDYLQKRGVRPGLEYRYTPNHHTRGEISGTFLHDKENGNDFWKVDATHKQNLPLGFKLNGKLDLEGDSDFNKTFADNIDQRSRRSSDSFASITRSWEATTLDIIARYRDSTEFGRDDTFAEIPSLTFQNLEQSFGPLVVNQKSHYDFFHLDLDPSATSDNNHDVHRLDFHPQVALPLSFGAWGTLTPRAGVRETYYSVGLDSAGKATGSFGRESFDLGATFEGPKVSRVFQNADAGAFKHIIEPRLTYNYIPAIDDKDRRKIKVIDDIDAVEPESRLTYSITQRLMKKSRMGENGFLTREVLRFDVSQSYDIREATGSAPPTGPREPFSELRFDLDSRLMERLLINADTTYDTHDGAFKTLNLEVGVEPFETLSFYVERRHVKDESTFITATVDWKALDYLRLTASTRYDEWNDTFRENNFSLLYDDPCRCWGLGFDLIDREIIADGLQQDETKFLFSITLRGLGSTRSGKDQQQLHRSY